MSRLAKEKKVREELAQVSEKMINGQTKDLHEMQKLKSQLSSSAYPLSAIKQITKFFAQPLARPVNPRFDGLHRAALNVSDLRVRLALIF